ncbi:Sec20-domain-containing protein [Zychaea mexicana]|uniref:Sec20-domain-containing protein n=1 Tax=Zychaea mexicana TaxID=64656 RepID=UPI0022FED2A6|nr:Sec20-domain-containing protein [Zychaea mexicana]KAI9499664.1 Sec20-domain-containing protein [Zychaea mexicana]
MSVETKFRSLNKRAAECQRQVERLNHVESIRAREDVASHIRSDLLELETDIKAIRELAEEDEDSSKVQILHRLSQYETQFRQLQTTSRAALWQSKKRLDEQTQKMRQELFGGLQKGDKSFTEQFELKQRRNRGQDQSLLRASTDVTEALRRTSTLMQQELEKSTYTTTMLADSSRTLGTTYTEYQNFGSLMVISKRLVGQLEAADWWDRLLLLFGLFVFITVVAYIIKKRTYDVGISWVNWIAGKGAKAAAAATKTGTTSTAMMATASPSAAMTTGDATNVVTETLAQVSGTLLSEIIPLSSSSSSSIASAAATPSSEIATVVTKKAVSVITETLAEASNVLLPDELISSATIPSFVTTATEHIKDEL